MNSLQIRTLLTIFLTITIPLIPFTSIGADNIDAKIATLIDTAEAFQAVSQKAKDAVVYVYVKKVTADNTAERNASKEFFNDPLLNNFFGEGTNNVPDTRDKQTTYAHGSGFIINNNGYILTNSHVINNAEEVTVRLIDKREFTARIIGQDQKSDVALIKIEA
ncbi:MAG: S1C family serine protease, partial [Proteobacteria bacterium]|nr:S1C family serine protease [Pseudomonadota bacterium]